MLEKQAFQKVTYSWNEPWRGTWGRDWEYAQKTCCSWKIHWRYGKASASSGDMHWGAAVFPFSSGLEWTSSKCPLLLYSKCTHLISSKQKWGKSHVLCLDLRNCAGIVHIWRESSCFSNAFIPLILMASSHCLPLESEMSQALQKLRFSLKLSFLLSSHILPGTAKLQ